MILTFFTGRSIAAASPAGPLAEWGLEPGRFLLFVGRLVPEKGLELLLSAHREVAPERGAALRVVVRQGPAHARSPGPAAGRSRPATAATAAAARSSTHATVSSRKIGRSRAALSSSTR